ncbi:MAG: hypothetical protein IPP18_16120 [Rhodocyclaceae bacterium]|nr:hypothetical protein [Rhodocyclaceae bacterium]MBK6675478.1 hypothetical protein [Rhodocyclaceae bacterium]MBK9956564.1 hypothetical protein [Rhodocyclaceae bacterium]
MKTRWGISMVLGLVAVLAMPPALAERGDGYPRHRFIRPDGAPPVYGERMEERMRMREFRRRERAADPDAPYFGRLSPDERRQLREDIRSAREGVYRRPPPPMAPLAP